MKIISFKHQNFQKITDHIQSGFPIILPTETSYGFSGNPFDINAVKSVEKIKNRDNKPFIWICDSWQRVEKYVFIPSSKKEDFFYSTVSPTTLLLEKKNISELDHYFPQFSEIGVRVPQHEVLLSFLSFIKTPIFSTSCNLSGENPLFDPYDIIQNFRQTPNLLFVDGGKIPNTPPSSIIRIKNNTYEKIR